MKKVVAISCLLILSAAVCAQNIEGFKSLEIRYGRTGFPGDLFKLQHERYLAERLNISVAGAVELSRKNEINYRCYILDGLIEYYTGLGFKTNDDLQLKIGTGLSASYVTEPNLYKDMSFKDKLNYGLLFNVTGEWAFTDDLSLTTTFTQRLYKKKDLGNFAFDYAVGLKWKIW